MLTRAPSQILRPFVKRLWATEANGEPAGAGREHVLPTGTMHLVFRLSDHPLRLYETADGAGGQTIGYEIVGGARSTFYIRDIPDGAESVGIQFLPGGADLLLGAPADELAERHTSLCDLWGRGAGEARERLLEAGSAGRRLDLLESLLTARLPRIRGLHPAVAQALDRFATTSNVRMVVTEYGYSHRRFIELFRRAVGLTPKLYCRVLRFQDALDRIASEPDESLVELALAAGYSDQPHFNREFRAFSGLRPGDYRRAQPCDSNHVPIRELKPVSRR
jgi:AraC-like DNA-binding protein